MNGSFEASVEILNVYKISLGAKLELTLLTIKYPTNWSCTKHFRNRPAQKMANDVSPLLPTSHRLLIRLFELLPPYNFTWSGWPVRCMKLWRGPTPPEWPCTVVTVCSTAHFWVILARDLPFPPSSKSRRSTILVLYYQEIGNELGEEKGGKRSGDLIPPDTRADIFARLHTDTVGSNYGIRWCLDSGCRPLHCIQRWTW